MNGNLCLAKKHGGRLAAIFAMCLAMLGWGVPLHAKPLLFDVRIGAHGEATRFVLELSQWLEFTATVSADKRRVLIRLPSVSWDPLSMESRGLGLVRDYQMGRPSPDVSLFTVELNAAARISNSFLLPPRGAGSHRLVIDLVPAGEGAEGANVEGPQESPGPTRRSGLVQVANRGAQSVTAEPARLEKYVPPKKPGEKVDVAGQDTISPDPIDADLAMLQQLPMPTRKPDRYRTKIVVIDAGHGGHDPGAIGRSGLREKHVTIAIARLVASKLEASGRYKAILTRRDDRFLRLRQRVAIARKAKADLFVSIHADSVGRRNVRGASVYTLSERASDREAAALAERENKADIIPGMDLSHENKEVSNILIDLAQRETMNQSARLAILMVRALGKRAKILQRPHRQAGFAVLKAPDVPSILIETGFLSNSADEKMLKSQKYRSVIADGIKEAIDDYFENLGSVES